MKNLPRLDLAADEPAGVGAGAIDACWRRIGVEGDRSCGELVRHVHCRNCAVYAGAAQRNLQRAVEPAYREAWARELARAEPPPTHTDAVAMVFRVGAEWLAVPLAVAASVAPVAPVHRLPHRRAGALLGVVNVDGRLVPAVSPALLLGIDAGAAPPPAGRHAFARLLVLAFDGQQVALPVDEVRGVLRHATAAMRAPAAAIGRALPGLVAGMIVAPGDSSFQAGLLAAAPLETALKDLLR
jgi:chemotaxis-related protein WspD